jgi:hypothetical protein
LDISLKLGCLLLFSSLVPAAFAAGPDAVVVVNGNSEVNREAYNFIRKTFHDSTAQFVLTATLNPNSVKPGQFRSVIVLNTGVASDLDPVLETFIAGYPSKRDVFLVNLYRNRPGLNVTAFSASESPAGVDGVTAPSTWKRPFSSNSGIEEMHSAWVKVLASFLRRR